MEDIIGGYNGVGNMVHDNRVSKFFFLKRLLLWGCLSLSLSAVANSSAHTQDFPASLPSPPDNLLLTGGNTPEYVIIRPSDQATFSSETAAVVANVLVKEGSHFQKGDILLQLDCRLQQADLKKALAQQTETQVAEQSAKKLKQYGSLSEFEFVKASSDAAIANAEVDKLRAIVEKCIIKAPFNGSVADIMAHAHESVKPGDPLLKIVSTDNLEFELQVPSLWLTWLHVGSIFSVHLNENNKVIAAKITKINPQIEPVSQSVKIVGTITPSDPTLLPGMSGQASFPDNPANKKPQTSKK